MKYTVILDKDVEIIIQRWIKSNPRMFEKLSRMLHELAEHPRTGLGHPEPLKGKGGITYSRHITAHDRIVYDIYDDKVEVLVVDLGGHYNDK